MALPIVPNDRLMACQYRDGTFGQCDISTGEPATSAERVAQEQLFRVPDHNRTPAEIAKEILGDPSKSGDEAYVPPDSEFEACSLIEWVTTPAECAKKATTDAVLRVALIAAGGFVVYLIVKRGIEKS